MKIEHLKDLAMDIAVVSSDEKVIVEVQSALDLVMTVKYETGASRIVLDPQHRRGRGDSPEVHQLPGKGRHLRRLLPLHQQAPVGLHL